MTFGPDDLCICIPTRRPPPVLTIESYLRDTEIPILLICDPELVGQHHEAHHELYNSTPKIMVIQGTRGMGAQSFNCYKFAAMLGYPKFFRMDDDLPPKTFIHKEGHYPEIDEVVGAAEACMDELKVTLVGFSNTSNRHWMGTRFKRTYGQIHGGANLSYSTHTPERFIDPTLLRCEDIYRTCAHRRYDQEQGGDGMNGRVDFIGFDKHKSTSKHGGNVGTIQITREESLEMRRRILDRFPEFVSQLDDDGVRFRR